MKKIKDLAMIVAGFVIIGYIVVVRAILMAGLAIRLAIKGK